MRKPNTFSTRKPTDTNQVDRDLICPPVIPQIASLEIKKVAPRAFAQRTIRAGKK
jgi:hypothetical protein